MKEFLFKYPAQIFRESEFIFASGWSLALLYSLVALCAVAVVAALVRKRQSLRWWQLGMLGALQIAMLALVLAVVWQPALVHKRLLPGENAVAILLDTSSSMALADGATTRMAQAQQLLTPDALKDLAATYQILPYAFSNGAQRLDDFTALPPPGQSTVLGRSLLDALRQGSGNSLGAVVLISDGADNGGGLSAAELAEISAFGVPVHTVGIGRESIPEDIELSEVQLPSKALAGTTLSARVTIRHDQGGTARLKVYDGDTFLSAEEITLDPAQSSTVALVNIDVPKPGRLDLRFTLDPLNGELTVANNSRARVVDVPDGRYKVLYVEGEPRWEYKFMQRALADDPSIQLSTLLKVTPNKYYRQGIDDPAQLADGFPSKRSELYAYDALIIGSMNVAQFSAEQQAMIRDFVSERGGSLVMLAGLQGLGLGGWGESVVGEVLPSRLSQGDADFIRVKVPVVLTDAGRDAPMLKFSDSDSDNIKQWSELPAVADYQKIGPLRPAATTLLEVNVDGQHLPLLVTQPYGRGQSFILATGGTWRWQMSLPLDDMRHETFWRQFGRNLVANSPRPFEVSAVAQNGNIVVRAEVRDPEAEENQNLSITAVASATSGEVVNLELLPVVGQSGVYQASFTPPTEGLYDIDAISRHGQELVSSVRSAIRYDQGQEAFGIRQNRALLEQISAATAGRYFTPAQWSQLKDAISFSNAGITEQQINYLWDAPMFFLLLFLLKSAEWLLRRRWRVI
ncbi:MAG: hypothetical protein LBF16_00440 [Pseudomonadales bacterium]|jgi:uncharacterized membrane protein|nr:hypothetical protein [Pseudomonadales bacterium]